MASWASIARKAEPEKAAAQPVQASEEGVHPLVAVVDANAIIAGQRLESLGAKRIVTIPEVLAEIRDAQSRTYLSSLPFSIETVEPSEESVKAILRFARETGDIQVLSSADVKLLALSHTLEVAAHGSSHLREHPVQARVRSKQNRKSNRRLQGWGTVPNPDEWKAIDEMEDQEAPEGMSRIIGAVRTLDLDGQPVAQSAPAAPALDFTAAPNVNPAAAATAAAAAGRTDTATGSHAAAAAQGAAFGVDQALHLKPAAAATTTALQGQDEAQASLSAQGAAPPADWMDEGDSEGDGDDDGWQTGGKSRGAVRKQRRKQRRHAAWVEAHPGAAAVAPATAPDASASTATASRPQEAAAPPAPAATAGPSSAASDKLASCSEQPQQSRPGAEPLSSEPASTSAGVAAVDGAHDGAGGDEDSDGGESSGGSDMDDDDDEASGSSMDDDDGESDDDDDETETTADATGTADGSAAPSSTVGDPEVLPNTTSSVMCVTADFAMQNVVLQMGMRLVTHDGLQVTRLSVWSLRCTACSAVTKEMGRLFCPRCGNMTMERVEVTVGPEGAEYFGVRKKHVLRGTRYALPKPKGGRSNGPILCEDVMMMRMGKKLRRMQRLQQQQQGLGGGATGGSGTVDAFAPEFGPDTWFKAQHTASDKGALALLAGWKHNPNERKGARTNRRK